MNAVGPNHVVKVVEARIGRLIVAMALQDFVEQALALFTGIARRHACDDHETQRLIRFNGIDRDRDLAVEQRVNLAEQAGVVAAAPQFKLRARAVALDVRIAHFRKCVQHWREHFFFVQQRSERGAIERVFRSHHVGRR